MKKPMKEILSTLLFAAILIGLGSVMIMNPDLGGYEPHGRYYLVKKIIVLIWGKTAGIIGLILGALSIFGVFVADTAETKADPES